MKHEVIIHKCVICGADVNCYDSSRPKNQRKRYCIDHKGNSCKDICPVPTHPRGGSFCAKHAQEALDKNKQEVDND